MEKAAQKEKEQEFYRFIVSEYLRYGSVDEIFSANNYDIPISYPGVHHLLDRWGVVKAAGPNTSLTESISFLVRMVEERIPLETLYKKMPPSFTPSMGTLHRMYRGVKNEVKKKIEERNFRRVGTALLITRKKDSSGVLIGNDVSAPRLDVGKTFGSLSLPMGFSKKKEASEISILRVLQQEVYSENAMNKNMPDIISNNPEPFMFIDIADVRVAVYHLPISKKILQENRFSSHKLRKHRFVNANEIELSDLGKGNYRSGVVEVLLAHKRFLEKEERVESPVYASSHLNLGLSALFLE